MTVADNIFDHAIPEPNSGCWLWLRGTNGPGYGVVRLGSMKDGTRRMAMAHRLAYESIHGPIPASLHVCHRCDNPACINPDHLFLGTRSDNMRDMTRKGRHGARKLTLKIANEIRSAQGPHDGIASMFRVSQPLVSAIKRGEIWAF